MNRIQRGSVALIIGWAVAAAGQPSTAPAVDVSVDARVELVCTIFRLAGNPEYNRSTVAGYSSDVGRHFGPFQDHAAIGLARRLRAARSISYDAPMSLAVHLADARSLDLIVPLDSRPEGMDGRWNLQDIREFQQAARDFAAASRFDEFLLSHQPFYDQVAQRLRETIDRHARLEWFDRFFGARASARFHVIIGLQNGGGNYGVHVSRPQGDELYCILGVWQSDSAGVPQFPASVIPTLVHEFNHSYANPLIDKHFAQLQSAGETLFRRNEAQMRSQAYSTGRTVLYESLVRACVVRYRYAHEGTVAASAEVLAQNARGFAWVGSLSALLDQYERQRDAYPTLDSFMPQIVKFFDDYVAATAPRP